MRLLRRVYGHWVNDPRCARIAVSILVLPVAAVAPAGRSRWHLVMNLSTYRQLLPDLSKVLGRAKRGRTAHHSARPWPIARLLTCRCRGGAAVAIRWQVVLVLDQRRYHAWRGSPLLAHSCKCSRRTAVCVIA